MIDGNLAMQNNISEWEPGDYIEFTYGFHKNVCLKLEKMYIDALSIKPDLELDSFIQVFIQDSIKVETIKDCILICSKRIKNKITDFPNHSYEQGITEALNWILGNRKEHPLTDINIKYK